MFCIASTLCSLLIVNRKLVNFYHKAPLVPSWVSTDKIGGLVPREGSPHDSVYSVFFEAPTGWAARDLRLEVSEAVPAGKEGIFAVFFHVGSQLALEDAVVRFDLGSRANSSFSLAVVVEARVEMYNCRVTVTAQNLNGTFGFSNQSRDLVVNRTTIDLTVTDIASVCGLVGALPASYTLTVENSTIIAEVAAPKVSGIADTVAGAVVLKNVSMSGSMTGANAAGLCQQVTGSLAANNLTHTLEISGASAVGLVSRIAGPVTIDNLTTSSTVDDNNARTCAPYFKTRTAAFTLKNAHGRLGGTWVQAAGAAQTSVDLSRYGVAVLDATKRKFVFPASLNLNNTAITIAAQTLQVDAGFGLFEAGSVFFNISISAPALNLSAAGALLVYRPATALLIDGCKFEMTAQSGSALSGLAWELVQPATIKASTLRLVLYSAATANLLAVTASQPISITGSTIESRAFANTTFGALVGTMTAKLSVASTKLELAVVNEKLGDAAVFIGAANAGFSFETSGSTFSARGIFTKCGCMTGSCAQITDAFCPAQVVSLATANFANRGSVTVEGTALAQLCALQGDFNWNGTVLELSAVSITTSKAVVAPLCPQPIVYGVLVRGSMAVSGDADTHASTLVGTSQATRVVKCTATARLQTTNAHGSALVAIGLSGATSISGSSFTGVVTGSGSGAAFVNRLVAGSLAVQDSTYLGFVRCAGSCGAVFAEARAGTETIVRGSTLNGSVSGAQVLGNGSISPLPFSGGVGGKMEGTFGQESSLSASSGVFNKQSCGSGTCAIPTYTASRTVTAAMFVAKAGAAYAYHYALGGEWDWNNTNVVLSQAPTFYGAFGVFESQPHYVNISVGGSISATGDFQFGPIVAILQTASRIEGCTVSASLSAASAQLAGLVSQTRQSLLVFNSAVTGTINGRLAAGAIWQASGSYAVTLTGLTFTATVTSTSYCGLVSVVDGGCTLSITSATIGGVITGKNRVGLAAFLDTNSKFVASSLTVNTRVTGTVNVGSVIGYSLASHVTMTSITSNSVMSSGMSIYSASIASHIAAGTHSVSNVNSQATGQFASCPVGYQSPYQFTATACKRTLFSSTSDPTRDGAGVANDLIGKYRDGNCCDVSYEYIAYWIKTTNYNHSTVSISKEFSSNGGNNYVSPFHYTYAWFEDILVSGELKYDFGYTSVGASILAFTNAPTTIVNCESSMKHTQTYSTKGGLTIGGLVGIAVHPLNIYACKSTVAYYCKTFAINDGYPYNDFCPIVFENRNTLTIENTVSSGSQSKAGTARSPDYAGFCFRCNSGSCTIRSSTITNGWSAVNEGSCNIL